MIALIFLHLYTYWGYSIMHTIRGGEGLYSALHFVSILISDPVSIVSSPSQLPIGL